MEDSQKIKIREFVLTELTDNGYKENIDDDESLIDAEILDSLAILKLISYLAEEFGIIAGENELDPSNFDSINAITEFVAKRL